MSGWFDGPWTVIDSHSLEANPRVQLGEIMVHTSGNLLLNCPKCHALQFSPLEVVGDKKTPTLRGVVTCGSGYCRRCGELDEQRRFVPTRFTVVAGRTKRAEEQPVREQQPPPWAGMPGVKRPPK